jgi:hypothetical protein
LETIYSRIISQVQKVLGEVVLVVGEKEQQQEDQEEVGCRMLVLGFPMEELLVLDMELGQNLHGRSS